MANRRLDEMDRQLIGLLKSNGREPTASLARRLELSRSAVQERMNRLERDGYIAGYTLQPGPALSRGRLKAVVRLITDPKKTAGMVSNLEKMPEVECCFAVSGAYDLIAIVEADSASHLNQVLVKVGGIAGIERTTSSIVLATEFDRRQL